MVSGEFLAIIPLPFDIPVLYDLLLLFLLLVIGVVIVILIAKVILFILPAGIIALVVWFLTQSLFLAGVAFLVVAFISLIRR
jgi:hypothetical protein